jgi:hypothetical protein
VPAELLVRWAPELAYAVGLIAADGNLVKGRHSVKFVSTDWELIEVYRACLQLDPDVRTYLRQLRQGHKPLYVVKFADRAFRACLEGVGLMPAKGREKTLGPLAVSHTVFRDFVRGCWDGDGGWHIARNRYLIACLTSASAAFLEWLQRIIEQQTGLYGGISAMQLRYQSSEAVALGCWLYYAPDVPALGRKRAIWEQFVGTSSG